MSKRTRRILFIVAGGLAAVAACLVLVRLASLWHMGHIGFYAGERIERPAAPSDGYHWPYRVYVPEGLGSDSRPLRLWVRPNNTSVGAHDDFTVHDGDASALLNVSRWQAEELGVAVLVPSFHRPRSDETAWGTHALDRVTLLREPPLGSLDKQLLAMVDGAIAELRGRGLAVCDRFLMDGFSSSGMFTSRFTAIHPDRVHAAAVGAPGGWPLVPVAAYEGEALGYPAGIADYEMLFGRPFPTAVAAKIPMLFFMGEHDDNDAVPYTDAFPEELGKRVRRLFGDAPRERWPHAEALFAGFSATFRLHSGVGHETPRAVVEDVLRFFKAHDDRGDCTAY